ncbi:MAG: hypothetical protein IPG98_05040 [Burkholderiales bacterium]|nr:hypothetical protein [Burkholderiales bacterium]MBK8666288.1 hypothetical protein [Burkholderiales bacterium]
MKSTLVIFLATVALVVVLGPPTLDVIKGTPNASADAQGDPAAPAAREASPDISP